MKNYTEKTPPHPHQKKKKKKKKTPTHNGNTTTPKNPTPHTHKNKPHPMGAPRPGGRTALKSAGPKAMTGPDRGGRKPWGT